MLRRSLQLATLARPTSLLLAEQQGLWSGSQVLSLGGARALASGESRGAAARAALAEHWRRHSQHQVSALREFTQQHGRLPRQGEAIAHGGQLLGLGDWLMYRRREAKAGHLSQELRGAMELAVGTELAGRLWQAWRARHSPGDMCRALAALVQRSGRLPHQGQTTVRDGQLLRLGRWLHRKRQAQRAGLLEPQLKRDIDAAVGPELAAGLWERWPSRGVHPPQLMLAALAALARQHGRLPRQREAVVHDGRELNIGSWLDTRRQACFRGELDPALRRGIEEAVGPALAARLWLRWRPAAYDPRLMCEALAAFVRQRCRLPTSVEDYEYGGQQLPLGPWLYSQGKARKTGRLEPSLEAAVEQAAGELKAGLWGRRKPKLYPPEEACAALAAFVARHGRLPLAREEVVHGGEQLRLGRWLICRRKRQREGRLDSALERAIEEAVGRELAAGLWEQQKPGRKAGG